MTRLTLAFRTAGGAAAAIAVAAALTIAAHAAPPQLSADEQQTLRARIVERYDVVPLTAGVALRPKSPRGDVRLIEISDTIAINGTQVSGRELRERVGSDADAILRLSYLDAKTLRELFAPAVERETPREPSAAPAPPPAPTPSAEEGRQWRRRSTGDRVRIFGDVIVNEDEYITGEVVAVLGSVKVNGGVGNQVVSVLGSIDLGPRAVVRGDIVSVGGRLRRAPGAEVHGTVTEVSLGDAGTRIHFPWFDWDGPVFDGFGPVARLVGTTFRFVLLALVTCLAFVVARRAVEGSAERVAADPIKATLVGLVAWMLFVPVMILIAVVLSISIIGIPLLLLMPFAVVVLLVMALVGFSGSAYAIGQWTRRQTGMGVTSGFGDILLGLVVILLPLLAARVIGLAGGMVTPLVFLLVATGLAVEFLAWSSGFGAVLTNAFSRWRARRP